MELVLENVMKEYKDKTALRNVNATLHSGQLIGLIGKNGAGKTTLVSLYPEGCLQTVKAGRNLFFTAFYGVGSILWIRLC